jgi:hypothetical protein
VRHSYLYLRTNRPEPFVACHSVKYRPHRLLVSLSHQSPAYLDEEYPITIVIANEDDRELDIMADVLLQPTEIDNAGTDSVLSLSKYTRNVVLNLRTQSIALLWTMSTLQA